MPCAPEHAQDEARCESRAPLKRLGRANSRQPSSSPTTTTKMTKSKIESAPTSTDDDASSRTATPAAPSASIAGKVPARPRTSAPDLPVHHTFQQGLDS
jgi:hypothetical protein